MSNPNLFAGREPAPTVTATPGSRRIVWIWILAWALALGGCASGEESPDGDPSAGFEVTDPGDPGAGGWGGDGPGGNLNGGDDPGQDDEDLNPGDGDRNDPDDGQGDQPGGGDPNGGDQPGGDPNPPARPPSVQCGPIADGLPSYVVVNNTIRLFTVRMPRDRSQMALMFVWHGFMQHPDGWANEIVYDVPQGRWMPFDPNAFPMPLMIVVPYDMKLLPPFGLDWDIVSGALDVPFFDAMLGCIFEQFNIDDSRIYSFGFSAGAVFTNLLASIYPQLFAATISESGVWFNDPAQQAEVIVPIMPWLWPALNPADGGSVLLTHGGPNDFATVISLQNANRKAMHHLYLNGRTVTECQHGFGHTLDPDLTQSMYYEWMWAHRRGGPPLQGLPPSFPVASRMVGSTFCTFHPAR